MKNSNTGLRSSQKVSLLTAAVIVASVGLYLPVAQAGQKRFTLWQILREGAFSQNLPTGVTWLPGQDAFVMAPQGTGSKGQEWVRVDAQTGQRSAWLSSDELDSSTLGQFTLSPDGTKFVFQDDLKIRLVEFDLITRKARPLTADAQGGEDIQYSPDGSRIGYSRSGDLYWLDLRSGQESRITQDGSDVVSNGDEPELLETDSGIDSSKGWIWSPDGQTIAFLRHDDSKVPLFPFFEYDSIEPKVSWKPYSSAGQPIRTSRLGLADLARGKIRWLDIDPDPETYLNRLQWIPGDGRLSLQRVPRSQKRAELLAVDPVTGSVSVLEKEESTTWAESSANVYFFHKRPGFIFTSERDGYRHIYLSDGRGGPPVQQLTQGAWEVTEVDRVDEESGKIYFLGKKDDAREENVYSLDIASREIQKIAPTGWHRQVSFSPQGGSFVDWRASLSNPVRVEAYRSDGARTAIIEEGSLPGLQDYARSQTEFRDFLAADGVTPLHGLIYKPFDFDPARQYPVLFYIYGGPGAQYASSDWLGFLGLWFDYLTQRGIVVVSVDNRGTPGRGKAFRSALYGKLGDVEAQDQIAVARELQALPWVNPERIGVTGASYGGYLTSMLLMKASPVFIVGVADASVTDWRGYESVYTEQFMGLPKENPTGYELSSVFHYADGLASPLLMIHGTRDTNVHFQQTAALVKSLIKKGKPVTGVFIPDMNHRFKSDTFTLYHRYKYATDFLMLHLLGHDSGENIPETESKLESFSLQKALSIYEVLRQPR